MAEQIVDRDGRKVTDLAGSVPRSRKVRAHPPMVGVVGEDAAIPAVLAPVAHAAALAIHAAAASAERNPVA